jgi:hypothetical protein
MTALLQQSLIAASREAIEDLLIRTKTHHEILLWGIKNPRLFLPPTPIYVSANVRRWPGSHRGVLQIVVLQQDPIFHMRKMNKPSRAGAGQISEPAKTGHQQVERASDGRYRSGFSGNPKGRPPGRRNRAAELFDEVVDDDTFRGIVRKAAELATEGNTPTIFAILRLKVPPPREAIARPFDLPELKSAADATKALRVIAEAAAQGEIDAEQARAVTATVVAWLEAYKITDLDRRLRRIEGTIE